MINTEELYQIIKDICQTEEAIHLDTTFEELGMDSTGIVEVLIECELKLNKDILTEGMDLQEMLKVGDVYRYLEHLSM